MPLPAACLDICRWFNSQGDELCYYRNGQFWHRHSIEREFKEVTLAGAKRWTFHKALHAAKEWGFTRGQWIDGVWVPEE